MKKILYYITFLIVAFGMTQCFMKTPKTNYTYTDQNNNRYMITSEMISYSPIKAEESSSGIYDGGDPKQVKISKEQFNKVTLLAESIFESDTGKTTKRQMMTSILSSRSDGTNGDFKTVTLTRSESRTALEKYLKEILN